MNDRRPPDRYQITRYGIIRRLLHARVSEAAAERWVVAWEQEARQRGLDPRSDDWWRPAWQWISDVRAKSP
jgi:hypothetical protein